MTALDAKRMHMRRRAIAEGWSPAMLAVAEDLADTARDDGTHALRTVLDQVERLGISESTVKRHRRDLQQRGVLAVRRKGGRGRGANVMDLIGDHGSHVGATVTRDDVTPDPDSGSRSGVGVTPDPSISGSIGGQSQVTVTRDREPRLLSSSPKQAAGQGPAASDEDAAAQWLAEQAGTSDLAACRRVVQYYAPRRRRGTPLQSFMAGCWRTNESEVRHQLEQLSTPRRQRTMAQCATTDPHDRHPWEDARNAFMCLGA